MSQSSPVPPQPGISLRPGAAVLPRGEEIASFATYPEAQAAVDSLSDDGFPVQVLAIIGTDLRQVERITGRMSWGRAVLAGSLSGLWIGMFFAAVMTLLGPGSQNRGVTFTGAMLLGVIWGIGFQVVGYAMSRGRRDFTSVSQVVASRYSIIAGQYAAEAARALAQAPGNLTPGGAAAQRAAQRRAAREAAGAGPTAFGSRPDEQPRFGVRLPEGADVNRYAASHGPEGQVGQAAGPSGAAGPGGLASRAEAAGQAGQEAGRAEVAGQDVAGQDSAAGRAEVADGGVAGPAGAGAVAGPGGAAGRDSAAGPGGLAGRRPSRDQVADRGSWGARAGEVVSPTVAPHGESEGRDKPERQGEAAEQDSAGQ